MNNSIFILVVHVILGMLVIIIILIPEISIYLIIFGLIVCVVSLKVFEFFNKDTEE